MKPTRTWKVFHHFYDKLEDYLNLHESEGYTIFSIECLANQGQLSIVCYKDE